MKIKSILNEKFKKEFVLSLVFIGTASIFLLLVFLVRISNFFAYIIAALFWASVVVSQTYFWKSNAQRKRLESAINTERVLRRKLPGVILFFKNKEAIFIDVVLLISAVFALILRVFNINISWLIMLSVFLLFISFNMHCILNGINYEYYRNLTKK